MDSSAFTTFPGSFGSSAFPLKEGLIVSTKTGSFPYSAKGPPGSKKRRLPSSSAPSAAFWSDISFSLNWSAACTRRALFDVADERHAARDHELVIIGLCIMLGQPLAPPFRLGIPAGDERSPSAWSASHAFLHLNWPVAVRQPFSALSTLTNLIDLPQPASQTT